MNDRRVAPSLRHRIRRAIALAAVVLSLTVIGFALRGMF